ncbi:MAG: PKD domain-containing protein [Brachybacterium tyrofermentans]
MASFSTTSFAKPRATGNVGDSSIETEATEATSSKQTTNQSSTGKTPRTSPTRDSSARDNNKSSQSKRSPIPDFFIESTTAETQTGYSCTTGVGGTNCNSSRNACQAGTDYNINSNGDVLAAPSSRRTQAGSQDMVTLEINRVDSGNGSRELLGYDCRAPGTAAPTAGTGADANAPAADAPAPIVITVSLSDFADMPIKPLAAHAGPADGWLPVNMPNVLYTDTKTQELDVELLDTPVAIRATPVSYEWDLGDGNTITTDNPGKPYPSEVVSGTYSTEGWYDITLTTTFTGQFAVDGGPWQDIAGSIEVASEPVPVYSKSLESRLVDGDVPVNNGEDPWIPERTADTEGIQDPHATHRTI